MATMVATPVVALVSIFKNRQNQAVRIPKAMSFPDDVTELEAQRVGDVLTLRPPRKSWASFFETWGKTKDASDEAFFEELERRHDVVEYRPVEFG